MTLADKKLTESNKVIALLGVRSSMWIAIFSNGHRITHPVAIRGAILSYLDSHPKVNLINLAWVQNGIRFRLDYTTGQMYRGGTLIKLPICTAFRPRRFIATQTYAFTPSSSPDPSPNITLEPSPNNSELVCVQLGYRNTLVGSAYVDIVLKIFPDDTWEWVTTYSVDPILVSSVTGVKYWKIFYGDTTVITKRMMNFEDAPTENVQVILLFFASGHPAFPRARLHGHDFYWKDGDTWGFSNTDPSLVSGHVKTGSWVSDDIWQWILYATKRDYTADGYTNPSPEW